MTTRTRVKPACRKMVGQSLNQRLFGGFTTAQAIEVNPMMDQINVTAQQTVGPEWIDFPSMSQDFDDPALIGSTQINEGAGGWSLPIDAPILWKGSSGRGLIVPASQVLPVGLSKTL